MNDIKIFSNQEFGNIRVAGTSEEPLFCLVDICGIIDIRNARNVKSRLDKDDVCLVDTIDSLGRNQQITFVSESGLYDVVIRSDSEKAKPFRKWITSEILPSIRKTGGYIIDKPEDTPEEILARAVLVAQDTIKRREEKIKQLEQLSKEQQETIEIQSPLANLGDAVMKYQDDITIKELATILDQKGFRTGEKRLFEFLREKGYLRKDNLPTQKSCDLDIMAVVKNGYTDRFGHVHVNTRTMITATGQKYFVNRLCYN